MSYRRRLSDYITGGSRQEAKPKARREEQSSELLYGKNIDIEKIIVKTAEVTVASYIKSIRDNLESLLSEIKLLREEIESLKKMCAQMKTVSQPSGYTRAQGALERGKRRSPLESRLETALDKYRYVLGSEARSRVGMSPSKLREIADSLGATIVEVGGDFAVIYPIHLREFDGILEGISTSDPDEASRKAGVYRRLFEKMRRAGLVYYDASRKAWRRL